LYLIHGWKVGVKDRNLVLFEKGEEAMKLGISLTVTADGQKFFVGRHLATTSVIEGEDYVGSRMPMLNEIALLKSQAYDLGLSTIEEPLLYVVAG